MLGCTVNKNSRLRVGGAGKHSLWSISLSLSFSLSLSLSLSISLSLSLSNTNTLSLSIPQCPTDEVKKPMSLKNFNFAFESFKDFKFTFEYVGTFTLHYVLHKGVGDGEVNHVVDVVSLLVGDDLSFVNQLRVGTFFSGNFDSALVLGQVLVRPYPHDVTINGFCCVFSKEPSVERSIPEIGLTYSYG